MTHPGAEAYIDSLADMYAEEWELDLLRCFEQEHNMLECFPHQVPKKKKGKIKAL